MIAFGKPEYIYMAYQMALSIKANNTDIAIQLVHDGHIGYLRPEYRKVFDHATELKHEHYNRNGIFEPGWAKVHALDYSVFDRTIFLDVDGICLKDLSAVFDQCSSFYHTEVIGKGGFEDEIHYAHWAENKDTWNHFSLDKDATFYAVQSSFQYFDKSKEAKNLFKKFKENFDYPVDKLKNHWGGCMPDELIIGGTLAQIGHDPSVDNPVTFFGNKGNRKPLAEVEANYYVSSLYGNGTGTRLVVDRYVDYYDRKIHTYARKMKKPVLKKAFQLMKKKHVG